MFLILNVSPVLQSPVQPFLEPPENSLESPTQPLVSTQEPVLVSLNVIPEVCIIMIVPCAVVVFHTSGFFAFYTRLNFYFLFIY